MMSALAEALEAAGHKSSDAILHGLALMAITAHPRDYQAAYDDFRRAVSQNASLLLALFARYEEAAIRPVLARAAEEYHRQRKPKVASGGGQSIGERQHSSAPAAQLSTGRAAVAEITRKSLLDTFIINGRPLGDVGAAEARSWGAARKRDARFIEIITAGISHVDHRPLRNLIRPDEAERAYKQAGETGNE